MIGSRVNTWLISMAHNFMAWTGRTLRVRIEGRSQSATSKGRLGVAMVALVTLAVAEAEVHL